MSERFSLRTPEGDTHERKVCDTCGYIAYDNPKIVVGSVVAHADQVLMCRRAIEPRRGYWTLPAGFMELGESGAEGAAREAMEEAGAAIPWGEIAFPSGHWALEAWRADPEGPLGAPGFEPVAYR